VAPKYSFQEMLLTPPDLSSDAAKLRNQHCNSFISYLQVDWNSKQVSHEPSKVVPPDIAVIFIWGTRYNHYCNTSQANTVITPSDFDFG